jgi:glycosyltransferase involved in cell wall biosynthesis
VEFREEQSPKIYIVTPTFNSARYLDATIVSVLSQAGDFEINYHIQDGGSSDSTVSILANWKEALATGAFPLLCKKLNFTYSVETDRGMYDAINKGVSVLNPEPSGVLTWLGSDDLLAPGALATVLSISRAFPDIAFLGGRHALIDADGIVQGIYRALPYAKTCMQVGLYDGRAQNFLMQEGTFWRGWLWHKVGGLDSSFRLAGDWDLWRRFAEHAEYYSLNTVTAFHRRREGQLSQQMDKYYAEVDAKLDEIGRAKYEETHSAFGENTEKKLEFSGMIALLAGMPKRWMLERHFCRTEHLPPRILAKGKIRESFAVRIVEGADGYEGPYQEFDLPAGIRWMHGSQLKAITNVPRSGNYILILTCRAIHENLHVRINVADTLLADFITKAQIVGLHRDVVLRCPAVLRAGINTFAVRVDPLTPKMADVGNRLLFVSWHIEPAIRTAFSFPKWKRESDEWDPNLG